MSGPDELDYLGIREEQSGDNTLLVEWPDRAGNALGEPDVEIFMEYDGTARRATVRALSEPAASIIQAIK